MTSATENPTIVGTTRPLVVQHTLAPPDGRTKYVDIMVDGAAPDVTIRYFTWKRALAADYDVFHVHWPELMIRGKKPLKRFARRRALQVLVFRLKRRRIPIVRTLHNVTPHEAGSAGENRSLDLVDRATSLYLRLNPTTELPTDAEAVTILHGHYIEKFAQYPLPEREHGRILYFGIIRPYKGVDLLFDAFRELPGDDLTLRVVGSPSVGQRELVEERVTRDPRTSALLAYVDDDVLVDEIGRAELVVLPYREMHNSGAILVALSLSRPALVPRSPANTALREEVGPGWVIEYDGELGPEQIAAALQTVRTVGADAAPDLSRRDWNVLGREHEAAYRRAIAIAEAAR
ncbi:glycosyltransferase [Leifsonia sp. Leaf264]|uniref:glycosyltransferase n=1 Tax=Leifsonia sp. Leaf264 TaxID=1736314 RepID=UPI0006F8AF8D|nr:glycosyltransferase [Leifsonia sp. Leaf264]KQO95399.1 hypothetical protein ASF30_20490 [Leifsonia sp. Leaf264]